MSKCKAIIYKGTTPLYCDKKSSHEGEPHHNLEDNIQWDMWVEEPEEKF
jgi:hypothetical protein